MEGTLKIRAHDTTDDQYQLFLVIYDYTESEVAKRCSFICQAKDTRAAAESFWQQHPGEWFHLISVTAGTSEFFWLEKEGKFVTVPGTESHDGHSSAGVGVSGYTGD